MVDCTALEMRRTGNRTVGSNPTLSAIADVFGFPSAEELDARHILHLCANLSHEVIIVSIKEGVGCAALPLGVLVLLIGSIIAIDKSFVWLGKSHAKALCANPGPLRIYDEPVWRRYSKAIRAYEDNGGADDEARQAHRHAVRQRLDISYRLRRATSF